MTRTDLPDLPEGFGWRVDASTAWIEARVDCARAIFTTRLGGASLPPFGSLNLGLLTGDDRGRVLENRLRVAGLTGIDPRRVAIARQVHGTELLTHAGPQRPALFTGEEGEPPRADGHVLTTEGVAAIVLAADCLPIVLHGPGGVAVLHGGWRGLAAGIIERGATAVGAEAMIVGPGIGRCCYAVGDQVLAKFAGLGEDVADGRMLDLPAVAIATGRRFGIKDATACGICTRCNPDLFFSHRRDGPRTGRQAGIGWFDA